MWYMARGCTQAPTILILTKGKVHMPPPQYGLMPAGGNGGAGLFQL